MKRILTLSAAALIAVSGAASAMTAGNATVQKFAPEADLSGYSNAAVAHILSIINDDGDDSFVQTQAQVRSALKHLQ
ncbi:hypothetical protein N6L24_08940 [Cognatishimia sp. SS12]|uniref:hypothetical protein n=1 Tax=Cognatishimia sp. SS12 TaxID=2979465 RepID=UPI00232E4C6F|nr:hypothetical protein [Cognatishimia sp. SS12]MDC0738405.1 hypothetical protein [Cognatishimia sp. SS12]